VPRSRWDAVAQGRGLAHQERRRLELGVAPLLEPAEVLESQGLAVLELRLPTGLSGFTVRFDGRVICGLNVNHAMTRQRFSIVHEYCHALVDHDRPGIVSSREMTDDLREVRANAFAIYFLAPADAIEHALQSLSKGLPTRPRAAVVAAGETEVEVVEGRLPPRSQEMGLWHACWLAARFGVSTEAMIWHLFNLKLIDEAARVRLHEAAQRGSAGTPTWWFDRPDPERHPIAPLRLAHRRLAGLALDAFRRELISRAKLVELLRLAHVDDEGIEALMSLVGPDDTEAASAGGA
jgi:Zn-dependent peptidase ImmA (M78 family)